MRKAYTLFNSLQIFDVPEEDCKEIITLLGEHPDWTDDEVTDCVMW